MKETFTDKLLKRFYGITGPLDERKRQQVDRVGNICFIWLFYILMIGNILAYFLGQKYPEFVAMAYPLALTFIAFLLYFAVANKQGFDVVQTIETEELDEKEQKQLKQVGFKAGLFFGLFMWLFGPGLLDLSYPSGLWSLKAILFGLFNAFFYGLCTHILSKARQK